VASFFRWLTIVVMALLIGHILLDALARFRRPSRRPQSTVWIERFNIHFRAQHLLLMASVLSLFLSGLFLFGTRYPGAQWASALSGAFGGLDFWRVVHRIGGTLLIATAGYHLLYSLLHEEGRRDFRLMLPTLTDFRHLGQNLLFFVGRASRPPAFGRFTYFEKFDYWAVFWGCVIMVGTGLALWFNDIVLLVFPGLTQRVFDAFKEAHAHEAALAILAIMIWHMYHIHVRTDRFPGSWLWVHGRMPRDEAEREHSMEPGLCGAEGRGPM
jgi:cytochrome b subunit of formate dehydrogenase